MASRRPFSSWARNGSAWSRSSGRSSSGLKPDHCIDTKLELSAIHSGFYGQDMSAMTLTSPAVVIAKPRLISGPLARMFAIEFGALMSFYLLLPVVPQYAMAAGAGRSGAGLATGALMLSTVAVELVMPRLLARYGDRLMLGAGVRFLGVPTLALPASANLAVVVGTCLLRGVGLAIVFVACGALGADVIPPQRRGEGRGVLRTVTGAPG